MKFCSDCASPLSLKIPADDTRVRHVCLICGTIHYQNPKLVLGTIPCWNQDGEAKVLLCKRAIEPRYGYWTLPAGFMENDETTAEGAQRETIEEAGANILLLDLFSLINVPHVHQVHLFYRATLLDLNYKAGTESLDVKLFAEHEIPWDDLAFSTVSQTLTLFFENLKTTKGEGNIKLHETTVAKATR